MARIDGKLLSELDARTSESLTRATVLHPIACGLAFIAFLTSLGAGMLGSSWRTHRYRIVDSNACVARSRFHSIRHCASSCEVRWERQPGSIWGRNMVPCCRLCVFVLREVVVAFTCCATHREKRKAEKSRTNFWGRPLLYFARNLEAACSDWIDEAAGYGNSSHSNTLPCFRLAALLSHRHSRRFGNVFENFVAQLQKD